MYPRRVLHTRHPATIHPTRPHSPPTYWIFVSTPSPLADWTRSLLHFGGHNGAHRVALRAGISMLVPLLTVWALGHIEWSLYAVFGAFAALYGRGEVFRPRLRMQLVAAVIMIVSLLLGVLVAMSPTAEWTVVIVGSAWAVVVATVSDYLKLHPPGPLFAVFALCAVASIPVTPGTAGPTFTIVLLVSAASAAFAMVVGTVGMLHPRRRAIAAATPARARVRHSIGSVTDFLRQPGALLRVLRFGIAAAVAGSLSTALGIGHPYWAMVASVVPLLAYDLSNSLVRGTHRVLGTVAGLVLAWGLLSLQPNALGTILIVFALQVLAELFVGRNYAITLIFVTPLALVMVELAHHVPTAQLVTDRAIETVLGTAVAIVIALATWMLRDRRRATA